ncbi:CD63 antigen [Drosophila montana]|uniref:CD63 antigen n=1 Tax=Drosophila montana TaxID=40370 RepID=UPI00313AFF50
MDCGGVLVKYVLFVFNILFVICGILLIIFGSLMVSEIKDFSSVDQTFTANSVAIIILILGCVIFLVSFLGCCGAIRENACGLTTYSIIMLGLFFCQIALIIYVWINHVQIRESLDKVVQTIWEQRKTDGLLMDTLQKSLKCCGLHKFSDYGVTYPASCCDTPTNGTCSLTSVMFKPGCKSAVDSLWDTNANIIKYAGLGVTAVELVAFIFACCLANQTRNNQRRQNF